MRCVVFWVFLHAAAAIVPLISGSAESPSRTVSEFPGWPETFQGAYLTQLELSERERFFTKGFPGKIARFSDGEREIVMRWVEHPTRKLHPAADCLKGAGFSVSPQPIAVDSGGERWGCVLAERGAERSKVCERILDSSGASWTDVSSWFWHAILKSSEGPWWAVTVAEQV